MDPIFSESKMEEIFAMLEMLNHNKSSSITNIVEEIEDLVRREMRYKCYYCEFSSCKRNIRDLHIVNSHKEELQCFRFNVLIMAKSAEPLQYKMPELIEKVAKIKQKSETFCEDSDPSNIMCFYHNCRLLLSVMLSAILKHFNIKPSNIETNISKIEKVVNDKLFVDSIVKAKNLINEINNISDANMGNIKIANQLIVHFCNIIRDLITMKERDNFRKMKKIDKKIQEINSRKTKLCNYFQSGYCRNGDRCNFAHGKKELKKSILY